MILSKRHLAVSLLAAALLFGGCSRDSDDPATDANGAQSDEETPAIERYRNALAAVTVSQQALAMTTAGFNAESWSTVAKQSLSEANTLQGRIEGLMTFDEAASAAAALRLHVAGMQRQLQGIDADNWQAVLPELLLLNESIRSDMDELTDLAATEPIEEPDHDHPHDPFEEL